MRKWSLAVAAIMALALIGTASADQRNSLVVSDPFRRIVSAGGAKITTANRITVTAGGADMATRGMRVSKSEQQGFHLNVWSTGAAIALTVTVQGASSENGPWIAADPATTFSVLLGGTFTRYDRYFSTSPEPPPSPYFRLIFPAGAVTYWVEGAEAWRY